MPQSFGGQESLPECLASTTGTSWIAGTFTLSLKGPETNGGRLSKEMVTSMEGAGLWPASLLCASECKAVDKAPEVCCSCALSSWRTVTIGPGACPSADVTLMSKDASEALTGALTGDELSGPVVWASEIVSASLLAAASEVPNVATRSSSCKQNRIINEEKQP